MRVMMAMTMAALLAAPALAQTLPQDEPGALGAAALARGDLPAAERGLVRSEGRLGDDPARLLNLARVYAKTGRTPKAAAVLTRVRDGRTAYEVVLADGRVMDSRAVARRALAALPPVALAKR